MMTIGLFSGDPVVVDPREKPGPTSSPHLFVSTRGSCTGAGESLTVTPTDYLIRQKNTEQTLLRINGIHRNVKVLQKFLLCNVFVGNLDANPAEWVFTI